VLLLLLFGLAPPAEGQPAPPPAAPAPPPAAPAPPPAADAAAADELKKQGDALMGDIRYEEALAKYRAAYELGANPALLYNQGRALEALSRFPEALTMLRAFDAKAPPELHARVPNLQKLIDDVANRTCLLTIVAKQGATIRIGDVVLGTTPLSETRVNSSKNAKLTATLEGFEPDVREVALPGGGKQTVTFDLVSKDKTGILAIDSPVKGASVTVDGRAARQVPTEVRVPAGRHTIKLSATGYRDNTVDVEVAIGERKPIIIEPGEPPVYERWWFWTIGGVILAGGGAAGISAALLTEASPDEGTIPPCQVRFAAEGDACVEAARIRPVRAGRAARAARPSSGVGGFSIGPFPVVTVRF